MSDTFRNLARLSKRGKTYLDHRLVEYGINSGQYFYIIFICNNEGITQDKLSAFIQVHPSNITRALEILCQKKYIVKKDLESDRRTCKLYPTEKAKDIYSKLLGFENEWVNIITNEFSNNERELLDALLKKAEVTLTKYLKSEQKGM